MESVQILGKVSGMAYLCRCIKSPPGEAPTEQGCHGGLFDVSLTTKKLSIMSIQPLKDEEIVFGTVFSDVHFSNFFSVNPTVGQLQRLWSLHDNIFSHCFCEDCGHKSYAFSDRMREDPWNPGHVAYHETVFFCPNCGARKGYGGSFFRSRAIQAVIRQDLGEVRD